MREASRLRATLGSEPSSGYAFHDKEIVDRIRPARELGAAPQAASHAPRERAFARTLAGGVTLQEAMAAHARSVGQPAVANDTGEAPATSNTSRKSWPPVPEELVAAALEHEHVSVVTLKRPSEPALPAKRSSEAPASVPVGGAIWQALPSALETQDESSQGSTSRTDDLKATHPDQPRAQPERAPVYRPSAADIEAEQAQAYGDPSPVPYERLVARGAWEELHEQLKRESAPSPALRLLALVARRETLKPTDKAGSAQLSLDAIATVAGILQVPENSPTALMLAKRLIRKNPGWTRERPASAGLSVAMLVGGLGVGASIGWLVTRLLF